jgi:uncharacterized protein YxjI
MTLRLPDLTRCDEYVVRQRRELAELFGFETRNKYEVLAGEERIALVAEKGRGFASAIGRQFLGHWRTFHLAMVSPTGELLLEATHPFRWFFQELHITTHDGRELGVLDQRFALIKKRFDVRFATTAAAEVASPLWTPWTFRLTRDGDEVARVEKKWSGLLKEAFTDADNFRVVFTPRALGNDERAVVLMAAVFVDLVYFEKKA